MASDETERERGIRALRPLPGDGERRNGAGARYQSFTPAPQGWQATKGSGSERKKTEAMLSLVARRNTHRFLRSRADCKLIGFLFVSKAFRGSEICSQSVPEAMVILKPKMFGF